MQNNEEKYLIKRTKCPTCSSCNLSEPIAPHINLKYPIFPFCVNTNNKDDDNFVQLFF